MPELIAQKRNGNHIVGAGWCPGCGLHHAVTGEHRADCTTEPSPLICAHPDCDAIRLPAEARDAQRRNQLWQYRPGTNEFFCPTHHQKGTTP